MVSSDARPDGRVPRGARCIETGTPPAARSAPERILPELLQDAVEVADGGEVDHDGALAGTEGDLDAGVEAIARGIRDLGEMVLPLSRRRLHRLRLGRDESRGRFGGAHGEVFVD